MDPKGVVLWVGVRITLPGTIPYSMRGSIHVDPRLIAGQNLVLGG